MTTRVESCLSVARLISSCSRDSRLGGARQLYPNKSDEGWLQVINVSLDGVTITEVNILVAYIIKYRCVAANITLVLYFRQTVISCKLVIQKSKGLL